MLNWFCSGTLMDITIYSLLCFQRSFWCNNIVSQTLIDANLPDACLAVLQFQIQLFLPMRVNVLFISICSSYPRTPNTHFKKQNLFYFFHFSAMFTLFTFICIGLRPLHGEKLIVFSFSFSSELRLIWTNKNMSLQNDSV